MHYQAVIRATGQSHSLHKPTASFITNYMPRTAKQPIWKRRCQQQLYTSNPFLPLNFCSQLDNTPLTVCLLQQCDRTSSLIPCSPRRALGELLSLSHLFMLTTLKTQGFSTLHFYWESIIKCRAAVLSGYFQKIKNKVTKHLSHTATVFSEHKSVWGFHFTLQRAAQRLRSTFRSMQGGVPGTGQREATILPTIPVTSRPVLSAHCHTNPIGILKLQPSPEHRCWEGCSPQPLWANFGREPDTEMEQLLPLSRPTAARGELSPLSEPPSPPDRALP